MRAYSSFVCTELTSYLCLAGRYGATQTALSPTEELLAINSLCALATATAFVATNADSRLYEKWHPLGLHVIPGLWSLNVACGHASLLPAALLEAAPALPAF